MQLHENLQICLLALLHRYPTHILDINETLLGPQPLGKSGWTVPDIIELFQCTEPAVLQAKAYIVLDQQESSIYLTDLSEEIPALCIHCKGKIPPYQGNMRTRRERKEQECLTHLSRLVTAKSR